MKHFTLRYTCAIIYLQDHAIANVIGVFSYFKTCYVFENVPAYSNKCNSYFIIICQHVMWFQICFVCQIRRFC